MSRIRNTLTICALESLKAKSQLSASFLSDAASQYPLDTIERVCLLQSQSNANHVYGLFGDKLSGFAAFQNHSDIGRDPIRPRWYPVWTYS